MNKPYITLQSFLTVSLLLLITISPSMSQQTVTIGSEDLNTRAVLKLDGDGSQGLLLPIADKDNFIPEAGDAGMLIYDSSDNLVYFWTGVAWVSVNTSTGGGSAFGLVLDVNTGDLNIVENGGNSNVSLAAMTVRGDITGTLDNTTIADGAVTLNKIANNGNVRSLLANGGNGTVAWLSPNNDNQVLGTDGAGDLAFRDVVDSGTGIAPAGSASDSRLVTEAAIRDALNSAGVTPSLQSAYEGESTIQLDGVNEFNISAPSSNPLLSTDGGNERIGIGTDSPTGKLSVNGNVVIIGDGDIASGLTFDPIIDLAIDDNDTGFEVSGDGTLTIVADAQEQAEISITNGFRIGTTNTASRVIFNSGSINFDGDFRPSDQAGVSGEVLTSQGAGLPPIWATATGSSPWTVNGNDVFYSTGNVGIGINTPMDALDVDGNISVSAGSGFLLENTQLISGNISLDNIYIGPFAGGSITSGRTNFFAGVNTGVSTDAGFSNTFVGSFSGEANTSGEENVFLGAASGQNNTTGNLNVMLGLAAGILNTTGSNNVLIGSNSNVSANNLTNAIAIGSNAVVSNSNTMVLGQSGTDIQFDGALLPANNAGTSGQVLTSSGPGAAPTWTTAAGGTSSLQGAYDGGGNVINLDGTNELTINTSSSNPLFVTDNNNARIGIGTATPAHTFDVDGNMGVSVNHGFFLGNVQFLGGSTTNDNVFLGGRAGNLFTTGTGNVFVGTNTGGETDNTSGNTFVGNNAGLRNTDASNNTFIGGGAGEENTTGDQNTFLGVSSGTVNLSGSRLTLLGYSSNTGVDGLTNATAIGHSAVVNNSNRMVLGVSGTDIQFDGALMPGNDAGLSGQVLTSAGPGTTPTWTTAAGGSSSLQAAYDGGESINLAANTDISISSTGDAGSTPIFYIDEEANGGLGQIGIGTNTPGAKLHVAGGSSTSDLIRLTSNSSIGTFTEYVNSSANPGSYTLGYLANTGVNPGFFTLLDDNAGVHRFVVTNNGDVGIGTTTPNTLLEVSSAGTTRSRTTSTGGDVSVELFRNGNSNVDYRLFSDSSDDLLKIQFSGDDFGSTSDALIVGSNGDIGIGQTPSTSLHVRHPGGIATSSLGEGISLSNATRSSRWTITHEYNSLPSFEDFQFSYNANLVAQIDQSGNYTQISDFRLKENIDNMQSILGKVMALRPVTYQFKKDNQQGGKKIGFIAQEVLTLFPTLVSGSGQATADGSMDYFSLNYSNMSVISIKAIQEQQKIIEKQEQEIEDLKKQLSKNNQSNTNTQSELELLKAQVEVLTNLIKAEAKK